LSSGVQLIGAATGANARDQRECAVSCSANQALRPTNDTGTDTDRCVKVVLLKLYVIIVIVILVIVVVIVDPRRGGEPVIIIEIPVVI
jgi:hypothetical protein